MKINKQGLQNITETVSKTELAKNNDMVKSCMYPFSKDYLDWVSKLTSYEVASMILANNSWIHNQKVHKDRIKKMKQNKTPYRTYTYKPGDIVMADLGGNNYGFEFSFYHPVVILKNDFSLVLAVPTSTKQYGSGLPNVIGVKQSSTGFKRDSGILVNNLRAIDKSRIKISNKKGGVIGKLGTDFPDVMNKVVEYNFKYHHSLITNLNQEVETLKEDLENKEEDYKKLEKEHKLLLKKLEELEKNSNK